MPAIYEYTHLVTAEEIDGQGHVNNLVYLQWMQAAAVAHSSAQGWTPQRYEEEQVAWVVRSHFIEYLQPAYVGQEIAVRTWIADFKKITSRRKYQIVRPSDDTLLAIAETNWAFLGLRNRTPRRIPQAFIDSFGVVGEEP